MVIVDGGRKKERTQEGQGCSVSQAAFFFLEAALFLSFIALFSLWHWLSNNSSNRTGWLWPTLAGKDLSCCGHTYTHTFHAHTVYVYLHWQDLHKHIKHMLIHFTFMYAHTEHIFHKDVSHTHTPAFVTQQCVGCFLPAGRAIVLLNLDHCSTWWSERVILSYHSIILNYFLNQFSVQVTKTVVYIRIILCSIYVFM